MSARHQIQAWFGTTYVERDQVLAWEAERAGKALRKLGVPTPTGGIADHRKALLNAKLALGQDATEKRLANEVRVSDASTRLIARASGRHRRTSQVELFASGVQAEQLTSWYTARAEADDEAVFLRACPDHHLFRPTQDLRGQEVWETTGGSPIASRFFLELDATVGLVTPADPRYSTQMVGTARLADGTVIGGIRHQFRDEPSGARVLLTVEFPWLIGPLIPAGHRWHLACEFSNWIQAASTGRGN